MNKTTAHCLTTDGDSHWYVVPVDRLEEFHALSRKIAAYWDFTDENADCPYIPEWAFSVGGPSLVIFTGFRIK